MNHMLYPFIALLFSLLSCGTPTTEAGSNATEVKSNETTSLVLEKVLGTDDIVGPMTIKGEFKNKNTLKGRYVFLYETEGKDIFVIDSAQVVDGVFTFSPEEVHVGLHRFGIFPDERQLGEIILNPNEKSIVVTLPTSNFKKGVTFSNSRENEGWSAYIIDRDAHDAGVKIIKQSKEPVAEKLKKLYADEAKLKVIEDRYAKEYDGTYFSKMVSHFQSSDRFDKDKYWDDFKFNDPTLIHSRVFSNRIMDFMRVHAKKENTTKDPELGYYNAVDFISNKVKEGENDRVLEFVLFTMSEGMYSSGHEDVSLYVIENYFYGDGCGDSEISELFKAKASGIRNLQVGNKPPVFTLPGHDGKVVDLQKVIDKNEYTLVLFWASYCHRCEEEIPLLKTMYDKYHDNGFEIVGVSVDLQKTAWLSAIKKNEFKWYNGADIKGWKGAVAKDYRVSSTPAMFLVNKNGTLIMRPKTAVKLQAFLDNKFGK